MIAMLERCASAQQARELPRTRCGAAPRFRPQNCGALDQTLPATGMSPNYCDFTTDFAFKATGQRPSRGALHLDGADRRVDDARKICEQAISDVLDMVHERAAGAAPAPHPISKHRARTLLRDLNRAHRTGLPRRRTPAPVCARAGVWRSRPRPGHSGEPADEDRNRLQPTAVRIFTGCRGSNRCPCWEIRRVNLVRLERPFAHQWLLGVPHDTGIIHTGVAVGGYAAPGHNEKKGRRNKQPHWINP
jgi:hypothetical protein